MSETTGTTIEDALGGNPFLQDGEPLPDIEELKRLSIGDIDVLEGRRGRGAIERYIEAHRWNQQAPARAAQRAREAAAREHEYRSNHDAAYVEQTENAREAARLLDPANHFTDAERKRKTEAILGPSLLDPEERNE